MVKGAKTLKVLVTGGTGFIGQALRSAEAAMERIVVSDNISVKRLLPASIRGANSLGDHVSGTVSLELHPAPISWGKTKSDAEAKAKKHGKKDVKKDAKKPKQAKGKR